MSESHFEQEIKFKESTIETIDVALFRWLEEEKDVYCTTNHGWEKVRCIWVAGERSGQIKADENNADELGTLIYPRITLERTDMQKDHEFRGAMQGHQENVNDYKGGTWPVAKIIKQKKTAEFANAESYRKVGQVNFKRKKKKPPVYEFYTIPQPVHIKMVYKVNLVSEYQQQMNEMIQPFLVDTGHVHHFRIENEGHKYDCFYDPNISMKNNVDNMGAEERRFETEFSINVRGYLIGAGKNEKYPRVTKRENAVEFKFTREKVIFMDDEDDSNAINKKREL